MKPRELTLRELQDINGGTDASSTSIGIESSTNSLLSLEYNWAQGDKSYQYKLEVGKDVHANANVLNNNAGS